MRAREVTILMTVLFILCITLQAYGAPLFGDVPDEHWARDAVANLAAKGLVEGYPDGTFKGDRAATRYEMAMVIARMLAKNDQEHATFATKADLEELRKLVMEYLDELEAFGVRVTNLEEQHVRLDKRVTELERIRFYGSFESICVSQYLGGPIQGIGSAQVPGVDWSNGRLLTSGVGVTALAKLGAQVTIAPEIDAGGEIAAYTSIGDPTIDQYWGIVPPYLSNPFLGAGTIDVLRGVQPLNNSPWTRATLDNFWVFHKPSQTKVLCGSFTPEMIDRCILAGPKNPNIHRPDYLPFYGAKISSYRENRLISWEVATARLPQDSGDIFNYNSLMIAGNLAFNFRNGKVGLNYLRAIDEMYSFGNIQNAGIIAIPLGRNWLDTRTNVLRGFAGPQAQNSYGLNLEYRFSPEIRFEGEIAGTDYNPDTSNTNFSATSSGSLARAGLFGDFNKRLILELTYISVSATYDPFLLRYQIPPNIPVILPYGSYYTNYWQLHDSNKYPSNRQGLSFYGNYDWTDTQINFSWGSLEQVSASTPDQMRTVGNIEPLFRTLVGGGTEKGKVSNWGIGISHTFPCKLDGYLQYYNYDISRPSTVALDNIDINENMYIAGLSYPIGRKMTLFGNYTIFTLNGNLGLFNQNFRQDIPTLGATYNLGKSSNIKLSYRTYDLKNYETTNANYNGSQTMMEYKVSF